MKKVLKSIGFLFLLVTSILIYFDFTVNTLNKDYLVSYGRGFEHKYQKLTSIKSNKIVVVGGSNVNFGIDSDLMEVLLETPVVNMGLHAGFNTFNIIEPVTPYLNKGDVLLISREYNEKLFGASVEVSNYFEFMPFLAKWQVYKNLDAISPILKCHVQNSQKNIINYDFTPQNKFKQGQYAASIFKNDNVKKNTIDFNMSQTTYDKFSVKKLKALNDDEVIKYYRELENELSAKSVKVFFSMPAIADNYYSSEDILNYYKTLSKKTGIPLLSENTYEFSREELSNSMYHLNAKGREIRSTVLAKELSKTLNTKANTLNRKFLASASVADPKKLEFNDLRQCKLIANQLTFNYYDKKNPSANYFRINVKDDFNAFTNKYFKIVVEGADELIDDIKFKAIGSSQDWDISYKERNKRVLIKNNVQGTVYKNGDSYLGISLDNLEKHHNKTISIHDIQISDFPFITRPKIDIALNKKFAVATDDLNSVLTIKIDNTTSQLSLLPNRKYIITNKTSELLISDLYRKESSSIKKPQKTSNVIIQFPNNISEVFDLQ